MGRGAGVGDEDQARIGRRGRRKRRRGEGLVQDHGLDQRTRRRYEPVRPIRVPPVIEAPRDPRDPPLLWVLVDQIDDRSCASGRRRERGAHGEGGPVDQPAAAIDLVVHTCVPRRDDRARFGLRHGGEVVDVAAALSAEAALGRPRHAIVVEGAGNDGDFVAIHDHLSIRSVDPGRGSFTPDGPWQESCIPVPHQEARVTGWIRGGLAAIAIGAAVWGAGAWGLDAYGHRSPAGTYDAIVVAGCRVQPDGQPSLALQRRTRHAVALWRQDRAPVIVFTGGVGQFPPSEAIAAATYARTLGVPDSAMILEDRSTSTEENARFAADTLDPTSRVLVVTDTYHVFRAERVFGRVFAEAAGAGSVPASFFRVRGAFREVLAVGAYAASGRL